MGLDTRREGCDFFRQPCLVKTVPHLFLVDAVHSLGHILGHRAGEHAEILKDRFKQLVVIPAVILPDILPVQQNTPPGGVKEAADQLDQCRLASAIQAHDGQVLAGVQCQAHVGDGVFLRTGVAVAHILQLQLIGHIQPLFQRDALLRHFLGLTAALLLEGCPPETGRVPAVRGTPGWWRCPGSACAGGQTAPSGL